MRLIDADELIEAIDNQDNWLSQMDLAQFNIYSLINTMPTVERPKGKWIPQTDYDGFTYWKCSKCGKKNDYEITDFCFRCGADMRKETENE